jgi:hypothetical protein
MIKIVALTDSSKEEEHQEDETITQVSKEAQVKQKFKFVKKVLLIQTPIGVKGNNCGVGVHACAVAEAKWKA